MTVENQLKRRLTGFDAFTFVVSDMVGSGIFFTTGFVAFSIGSSSGILLAWFVGGVLALLGALSYAELAAAFPRAGGEYNYLSEAYSPLFGFLSGWTSWIIGFSAPIAISSLGFAAYASSIVSADFANRSFLDIPFVTFNGSSLIAVSVIVLLVLLQILRAGSDRRTQQALTVVKVVALVGLIAAAFFSGRGDFGLLASALPDDQTTVVAFMAGLVPIMFSYSGWNASSYIAGEIENPARNLPLSLITGTLFVTVLYMAINLVFLHALPITEIKGAGAIGEKALRHLLGEGASTLVSAVIAVSIVGAVYTMLFIAPRVLFAMSRDGVFFPFAGRVDPSTGVPTGSILTIAGFAVVMVLLGDLRSLLEFAGFVLVSFNFLAVFSVFVLRWRRPQMERPYRVPFFPLPPAIFCAFAVYLMYASFVFRWKSTVAGIVVVLLGVPGYFLFKRVARGKG